MRVTRQCRIQVLALAMALCLSQSACGAGSAQNSQATLPNRGSNETVDGMKIRITVGDKKVTATLIDSDTARDFISLLPLTLTLEDYNKTEKISDLPKRLSTKGAPSGGDPSVGDIAYYAPWGNLAIYYKDFDYSSGLVILGKIEGDMEVFNQPGSIKATIELVK